MPPPQSPDRRHRPSTRVPRPQATLRAATPRRRAATVQRTCVILSGLNPRERASRDHGSQAKYERCRKRRFPLDVRAELWEDRIATFDLPKLRLGRAAALSGGGFVSGLRLSLEPVRRDHEV